MQQFLYFVTLFVAFLLIGVYTSSLKKYIRTVVLVGNGV